MNKFLTLVAAVIVSVQTGYCAGTAFDSLTSLSDKKAVSAAGDAAAAADNIAPRKVTLFPARLNGTFNVTCAGSPRLGGLELNLKLADQGGKTVKLSAEMGKTPVGSKDALLLLIDQAAGPRLAAWWLMENGGDAADRNNGYDRGFNETGVFYDKTAEDDREMKLYVRKSAPSLTDIAASIAVGAGDPDNWLEASSMATELKESVAEQADGSLIYKYKAAGRRTFISDKEVDSAVSGFMKRAMIKARIKQLKARNPDINAEGQCRLERAGK